LVSDLIPPDDILSDLVSACLFKAVNSVFSISSTIFEGLTMAGCLTQVLIRMTLIIWWAVCKMKSITV
jgi:hypothetical protein